MSTDEIHDHDRGLSHDLPRIVEQGVARRRLLGLLGGVSAAAVLAACGSDDETGSATVSTPSATTVDASAGEIPEETAGPFPGDGSNGANVLAQSGVVRSDIRSSFGGASGVAEGVPLTVRLKVYDLTGSEVQALSGAAVYVWHCNRAGEYSMYSADVADENYLRGVQETDSSGLVEFTTIFPAAYDGRWPHIHFEVYPSVDDATSASNKLRTSQLALPEDICKQVYEADGYDASVGNLERVSLSTDMVFSDGYSLQMPTVTGSNDDGWVATLNVPV
ncbi:MAG: 3,4-dioxygenase subunit beta [Propionibacteriales bacterium]|jgi:protocatechuate 3,4-dioxygenase beta subunit|nr:3,4-dioxygenase subunit beta [Propionibacteriales bacterium]